MPKQAPKAPSFAPILAGLLILSTVTSCTDDFPPFCPPYHVGAIEGYVSEAGVGVVAEVRADAREGATTVETTTDSTGWYRLELPSGLYRMAARIPGLSYSSVSSDTVRVAQGARRYDFVRGRAEISVALPPELAGRSLSLQLLRSRFYGLSIRATPVAGVVSFTMRLQRPGRFAMYLGLDDAWNDCYLPGTTDPRAADSLTVGVDTVSRYHADLRPVCASISGRITGSWQEAAWIAPVVAATPAYGGGEISRTDCAGDGSFTLHFLAPQDVRLSTEIAGVHQWIGGESLADARVFALQPGDRVADVTLVESGIDIRLEGPGDQIDYWATVVVRSEAGEEFQPYATSINPLPVCNLRPGRYYVHLDGRCYHQGWAPQWYGGAERLEDATPIDLEPGELRPIVVDLVAGGRIAGDVLTADGSRPSFVSMQLLDAADEPVCEYGTSFNDGAFDLTGLGDGDYRLAVRDYLHDPWWWPGTYDPEAAVPITIAGHAAVTGLRWSLPPDGKAVQP